MATPSLTRTKKPLASGASASPTLGQGDPLKQALQGTPAPASAPTKSGMIAISPNVEQAKTQWDYMQNSGNPLYSNANFGGINIPVNNVTGNPLSLDRRDYETRQATNQVVDARLRDRAMTTPYKQHYGTGLGTGVAPINVLAEDYRKAAQEADFEQLRAENRAAFERAKSMDMSPTKYKIGRSNSDLEEQVKLGGTAGEQAQNMLNARAAGDAREEAKRQLKAQRGIEMGNAQAAARTFRMTGVSPNQGFTDQLMSRLDPRGAWDARAATETAKMQQSIANDNRAFEREKFKVGSDLQSKVADAQIAENTANAARYKAEADKTALATDAARRELGVQKDGTVIPVIPGQLTPDQSAKFSEASARYKDLRGSDLYDAMSPALDDLANTAPEYRAQRAFELGITPEMLDELANYRPMIPSPKDPNRSGYMDPFSVPFGETEAEFSDRLRRQTKAKELADQLRRRSIAPGGPSKNVPNDLKSALTAPISQPGAAQPLPPKVQQARQMR